MTNRPQTRAECQQGPRPCPYVGCRYHLYLDINPRGGKIMINYPDTDPCDMVESCALDIAENQGSLVFTEIGEILNLTKQRAVQICAKAIKRITESKCMNQYKGHVRSIQPCGLSYPSDDYIKGLNSVAFKTQVNQACNSFVEKLRDKYEQERKPFHEIQTG